MQVRRDGGESPSAVALGAMTNADDDADGGDDDDDGRAVTSARDAGGSTRSRHAPISVRHAKERGRRTPRTADGEYLACARCLAPRYFAIPSAVARAFTLS